MGLINMFSKASALRSVTHLRCLASGVIVLNHSLEKKTRIQLLLGFLFQPQHIGLLECTGVIDGFIGEWMNGGLHVRCMDGCITEGGFSGLMFSLETLDHFRQSF